MGYERYTRGTNSQGDDYGRNETQDYGRDYESGRRLSNPSARDDSRAGQYDRDDNRGGADRDSYGRREYGNSGYGRDAQRGDRGYGDRGYGDRGYGESGFGGGDRGRYGAQASGQSRYGDDRERFQRQDYGNQSYGSQDYGRGGQQGYGQQGRDYGRPEQGSGGYRGSYASDGRRFQDVGSRRHADDDNYRGGQQSRGGDYGRQPQGYDYEDRGFLARAGDEVRSWFGDEDAERRREADNQYDERYDNQRDDGHRDGDYHSWRSGQIASFDRDYNEYRQENRTKFHNEFASWRTERQSQRDSLDKVQEHDEVVGSDGSHVGTVDKVRGDRILLTKNDADAGGQHHSIPSRWIKSVDDKKVTLTKSADEAKQHWRTEEKNQAMFGYGDRGRDDDRSRDTALGSASAAGSSATTGSAATRAASTSSSDASSDDTPGSTNLNRSFSGTY